MIRLTRLKGGVMHLNAELVALVEAHHDTVITLVDGKTYVVAETAQHVVDEIITYRASVLARAEQLLAEPVGDRPARLVVLHGDDSDATPSAERRP